ncbi:hypothetical protein GCM10010172_39370 [Paractinoplanes ferrugineus]|uniref:Uncharacterized protein n=1 Tax=Paractinoplanes ferrugineus TaxID=113564 RepID=A0A919J2H2_9ACTN|nr:hypothetical protein Afe05nite_45530 [Actinoplanes ferrugineus]
MEGRRYFGQRDMLVFTGASVGSPTVPEFELSQLEVLLEITPFIVGRFTILVLWTYLPPRLQEAAIRADEIILKDCEVMLGRGQVGMPQKPRHDMNRKPAGDGLGSKHSPKVVRRETQRFS